MNPKAQYVDQQSKVCREQWFKDHRATMLGNPITPAARVISWENPKSWNYGCRFIIHRRWLCVVGDIGEAVFEWSQDITLEFLASLDFGYFHSKCQASNSGRDFEQFDGEVAWKNAGQYIEELRALPPEDRHEHYAEEMEVLDSLDQSSCKDDYDTAARDIYDATGDAETASTVSDWGKVPSAHAIGMFVGLQMAIEQLKANPE